MKLVYKKTAIIFLSIMAFSIAAFLSIGYTQKNALSKIIDPSDPRFVVEDFRWDDYKTSKEFEDVLRTLFPIGTDRSFVEKILTTDPRTIVSQPESVEEQKKKTGGFVMGQLYDKILYSDPKFQNATTIISYHNPVRNFFQMNFFRPNSSSRIIYVYYDAQGHLLNLVFYSRIIHIQPTTER